MKISTIPSVKNLVLSYQSTLSAPSNVASFSGSSSIVAALSAFPQVGLTVEFWICTSQTTEGAVILSCESTGGPAGNRFWIKTPANLQIGLGANATAATGISVADGLWHHVAVTLAPFSSTLASVGIYIDGTLAWGSMGGITIIANAWPPAAATLTLGASETGEQPLVAQVSEFHLWNAVLSADQIATGMAVRASSSAANAVLVWALTTAPGSATVTGVSFLLGAPTLEFYVSRQLTATWDSAGPDYNYTLTLTGGKDWFAPINMVSETSYTISTFCINTTYTVTVVATQDSVTGPPSSAAVATIDLPVPVPTATSPSNGTFQANWEPVDQATGYVLNLTPTGEASTSTLLITPSADLSSPAFQQPGSSTYTLAAAIGAITGPHSLSPTLPTAPTAALTYTQDAAPPGTLSLSLTQIDAQLPYLIQILQSGAATPVATPVLPAGTSTYTVVSNTTFSSGQHFTATARAVPVGVIGPVSNIAAVTLTDIAGPLISQVVGDDTAHTVTVTFQNGDPSITNPTFTAELWNGTGTRLSKVSPATSPVTLSSPLVIDGAALKVRVRAMDGSNCGRWSAWSSLTIGGPAQVQNVTASMDSAGNITVNWTALTQQNVTYVVHLLGGKVDYSTSPLSGSSTNLAASVTNVVPGPTYSVTVTAQVPGPIYGPPSETAAVVMPVVPPPVTHSDPIDVRSGSYLYSNDDLVVPGVVPLVFSTRYSGSWPTHAENSLYPVSPLGHRWTHSYMTRIVSSSGYLSVFWADQRIERFQIPPSVTGTQIPSGTLPGTVLVLGADQNFTLTTADARTYRFNSSGLLTTLADRYGNTVQLAYNGNGLLQSITDTVSGRALTLAYNSQNQLHTVTDPLGRTVTYLQNASGDLESIQDPCGNTRKFVYTGSSLMQSAIDGNGNQVMCNTYTGTQVTTQQDARAIASKASYATIFNYQPGTQGNIKQMVTTGTDPAGNDFSYTTATLTGTTTARQQMLSQGQILAEESVYDGANNLTQKTTYIGPKAGYTPGTGNTTTYSYDGNGNCLSEITPLTATTVYAVSRTFDASGNKLTEAFYEGPLSGYTPGSGNQWVFTYNADNSLATATNPLGQKIKLTYQANALPHTVTDYLGNTTTYVYTNGALTSKTNALGEVIQYVPDAIGRPSKITYTTSSGPALATVDLTYNYNSQVLTRTLTLAGQTTGFTTTYKYDGNGNRISIEDAAGNTTQYEYNQNNYLDTIRYGTSGENQHTVNYKYDPLNFLESTTLTSTAPGAISVTSQTVCNAIGQVLQEIDPNGNTYTYSDIMLATQGAPPFLRQQTATWPLLQGTGTPCSKVTTFDPIGRPLSFIGLDGQTVTIAYSTQADPGTHTLQSAATITYPAAAAKPATTQVIVHDALGRIIAVTDQNGKTTTYAYGVESETNGAISATVTVTDPVGNITVLSYDQRQRLIGEAKGQGSLLRTRGFTYDCLSRLTTQTTGQSAASATTTYTYGVDNTDNTWTVSIGRPGIDSGPTVQYYDGLDRLVKQVEPFETTTTTTYTPWGGIASFINGRGQTLEYGFDAAGRLLQTTIPGGDPIIYTLDNNGNRLTAKQGSQVVTYTYDTWNRKLSRKGVEGATIGYAYWPEGQIKTLTYSDGKTVNYEIDALGRLISVTDWTQPAGRVVTYGYTPDNRLSSIVYPNGAACDYAYDPAGRLNSISHTSNGLVIAQWQAYYDALGQLASAKVIEPLVPLAPEAATLTYGANNQLLTVGGIPSVFDTDGNYLGTSVTAPTNSYDIFGRLSAISASPGPATFTYDPDGLRVTSVIGGTTANYVFDINGFQSPMVQRGDPVRALDGTITRPTAFAMLAPDPFYLDGRVCSMNDAVDRVLEIRDETQAIHTRFIHGQGLIGQQDSAGNSRYYHFDPVGNLWAMTDGSSGAVTDAAVFGPFGQVFAQSGDTPTPFRFSGQFGVIDDGIGILYMRARSYSPAQMRFLQPDFLLGDPLAPQSFNQYAYSQGNPAQASDPLGLDTWKIVGRVIAGLIVVGGAAAAGSSSGGNFLGSLFSSISDSISDSISSISNSIKRFFRNGYRRVPTEDSGQEMGRQESGGTVENQPPSSAGTNAGMPRETGGTTTPRSQTPADETSGATTPRDVVRTIRQRKITSQFSPKI